MDPIEYLYGVPISKLVTTGDKVYYGALLLTTLVEQQPLDAQRIYDVAQTLNQNNKILKGGI